MSAASPRVPLPIDTMAQRKIVIGKKGKKYHLIHGMRLLMTARLDAEFPMFSSNLFFWGVTCLWNMFMLHVNLLLWEEQWSNAQVKAKMKARI